MTESRDCGSSLTGQHLRSIGITRATSISGSSNSKLFLVIKYIMSKNLQIIIINLAVAIKKTDILNLFMTALPKIVYRMCPAHSFVEW